MKRTVADWKLKHAESVKQFVRSGGSDMLAVADFVNSASHKTSVDRRDDRRDSLLGSGDRGDGSIAATLCQNVCNFIVVVVVVVVVSSDARSTSGYAELRLLLIQKCRLLLSVTVCVSIVAVEHW
uniref:Uncharacterized protein n=1 Tax=Plectus sambesii TaxID=2011161 RepID=A0A914WJ06_9BILA